MVLYAIQGRHLVNNPLQRRLQLEAREKQLHEQLAEDTRQLQSARAKVKSCEAAMEQTLKELHEIRQEYNELTDLIEGVWNGQAGATRRTTNS